MPQNAHCRRQPGPSAHHLGSFALSPIYLPCCHRRPRTQTQRQRLACRRFILTWPWDPCLRKGGWEQEGRSSCRVALGEVSATTTVRIPTSFGVRGLYTPMSICYWMPATLGRDVTLSSSSLPRRQPPVLGEKSFTPKGGLGGACQHPPQQFNENMQSNRWFLGLRKGLEATTISNAQNLCNPGSDIITVIP